MREDKVVENEKVVEKDKLVEEQVVEEDRAKDVNLKMSKMEVKEMVDREKYTDTKNVSSVLTKHISTGHVVQSDDASSILLQEVDWRRSRIRAGEESGPGEGAG